jgi:hypothetical protein
MHFPPLIIPNVSFLVEKYLSSKDWSSKMASKAPTALDSLTAVQWAWRADDKWILYADKNLELENEYHAGTKKVKIDKERFVDLSLSVRIPQFSRSFLSVFASLSKMLQFGCKYL